MGEPIPYPPARPFLLTNHGDKMPTFIHRLQLADQAYVLGKVWPTTEDELEGIPKEQRAAVIEQLQKLKIGMIYFRPELRDDVNDGSLTGAATEPAHYEVWCINEDLGAQIRQLNELQERGALQQRAELLKSMGGIRKRKVYLDKVLFADEILTPDDALDEINDRTAEQLEEESTGQQQQQPQPTNGQQPAQGV